VNLGRAEPVVTGLAAGLVRGLAATWRSRVHGWGHVEAARASRRPVVYILWHSRIGGAHSLLQLDSALDSVHGTSKLD